MSLYLSLCVSLSLYLSWMLLTHCQDRILTENIWFVWSRTSYSGDKWRCYRCGTDEQTTNEQGKIVLLSQWMLDAEFRNIGQASNFSWGSTKMFAGRQKKCLLVHNSVRCWAEDWGQARGPRSATLIKLIKTPGLARVAKCQGYWGYIRVKMFAGWGKKFERTCNFAKSSLFGKIYASFSSFPCKN